MLEFLGVFCIILPTIINLSLPLYYFYFIFFLPIVCLETFFSQDLNVLYFSSFLIITYYHYQFFLSLNSKDSFSFFFLFLFSFLTEKHY